MFFTETETYCFPNINLCEPSNFKLKEFYSISGFSLIIKVTSLYLSHNKRRENINEQQNKDVYFWKKTLSFP